MTLVGILVTALAPSFTVVVTFILARRKIDSVHDIVNSQRTEMMKEITSLRQELAEAQIIPTTPHTNT